MKSGRFGVKTLVVGDLHIECGHLKSERTAQTKETLRWVLAEIDRLQPEVFVHLGDFGEDNRGVDHYSLSLMSWFISEVCRQVGRSYWLVGNHDYFTADGGINLMSSLSPLMPDQHQVVWPWATGPDGIMFVSYLREGSEDKVRSELGLVWSESADCVLFSHLPVRGAMFAPGRLDEEGMDPAWFPRQTIVGHYHRPNPPTELQMGTGRWIWYAGSPMSHDFRDNCYNLEPRQQLRGIWLFDIQSGVITSAPVFIENPHARYFLAFNADFEYDSSANSCKVFDDWFNLRCQIPLERTSLRLTVPPGKEGLATDVFGRIFQSVSVLRSDQHDSVSSLGEAAIDPQADPALAVEEYVAGLSADKLKGLDRRVLSETGAAIIRGTYQLPEGLLP